MCIRKTDVDIKAFIPKNKTSKLYEKRDKQKRNRKTLASFREINLRRLYIQMEWQKGCRRLKKENIPIIPTTLRAASADTILADQQSQGGFNYQR
jgi:hypothetical protein